MIKHITLYSLLLLLAGAALSGCSDSVAVNQPQGSDNAYRVVFSRYDWSQANSSIPELMMIDTSGKNLSDLGLGFVTGTAHNKILYAMSNSANKASSLVVADNAGNGHVVYKWDTVHVLQQFPRLSLDGSAIVFSVRDTNPNSPFRVATMKADGSGLRIFDDIESHETEPGISPDGRYIAYYRSSSTDTSLVVSTTDGSVANKIVSIADKMVDFAGEVVWNPDGNRLAYTDADEIYVINKDGSNRIHVAHGLQPRWSPDGAKLMFVQNPGDFMWDIMVTPDLGLTMNNVTNTTAQWELYPEWSPDGRYIVCQTGTGDPEQSTSSIKLIEIATGATRTLGTPGALPFFTR